MDLSFPTDPQKFLEGHLLLVDKPLNWTSFDVVNKIRYNLKKLLKVKKIKVGHAGTLDPLATGLLLIATGRFTKKLTALQLEGKTYEGSIKLGCTTASFDAEQPEENLKDTSHINIEDIEKALVDFRGEISQVPPIFSAIKKDGVKLYQKARKGIAVKIDPRNVTIEEFSILSYEEPTIEFRVACSKGTYIRSLANDLGNSLGTGGYLSRLVRTKIGLYDIKDSLTIDQLLERMGKMEEQV